MDNITIDQLSTPEARGKRIRFIREHLLSLTREKFCHSTNITPQSLKGWELAWGGGLSPQGAEKIIKRSKDLNIYCTEPWLMYGIGRAAVFLTQDLLFQENDENHIAKELLLFRELPNTIDTMIKDDGMIPLLYPGNYVGGIIIKNIKNIIGKECIIVTDNNETYVRVLKPSSNIDKFNLICLNEQVTMVKKEIKNTGIKFAAPIIWIRRTFQENL